jgi:prepilin-type N-terminal cleavage/methylation domain-containing protein
MRKGVCRVSDRRGFSLVELSIVLVILGLLTGGILTGQNLIRAAELRSAVTELQRHQASTQSFRDKYFAIPGDMSNATRFWGRMSSGADCLTNSAAAVDAAAGVCDGNGDGALSAAGGASVSGELFQFWRQLANAGMVEGTYTGISGPGGGLNTIAGTNIPQSKIAMAGWSARTMDQTAAAGATYYSLNYRNHFLLGKGNATWENYDPVMTPAEAWGIDKKVDDGKPAYGKVIARFYNDACSAADNGSHTYDNFEASYKLTDATIQCALYFRDTF